MMPAIMLVRRSPGAANSSVSIGIRGPVEKEVTARWRIP
jgi:hypothetical protein